MLIIREEDLITKICDEVKDADWDTLCSIAEHVLGGKFFPDKENNCARLEKDESYAGAFDYLEKQGEDDEGAEDKLPWYENHYTCSCGQQWTDEWDCQCNDRCPECNKEIEPEKSVLLRGKE